MWAGFQFWSTLSSASCSPPKQISWFTRSAVPLSPQKG
jgi:hypothetical protein